MAVSRFSNSRIGEGFPKYQSFITSDSSVVVDYLAVAGGGGAGYQHGGGGGAGVLDLLLQLQVD